MWRVRACLVLLVGCAFEHGQPTTTDAPTCTRTPVWWDPAFTTRFPLSVSAPPGYTLRVDASAALGAGPDVRVVVHDPVPYEIDRVLESPAVLFKVPAAGSVWLYAGPGSGTAKADASNVFLFAESFESIALGTNADGPFVPQPPNEWIVTDDGGNRVYRAAGIARHPNAIRGLPLDDGEISARMRFGLGGGENHNGFAVRSNSLDTSTMDGFVAQMQENVQRVRLGEYVDGASPVELAGIDRTVARLTWYRLRLRFVGETLSFYVDDQLVVSASKSGADGRLLGLFTFNSVVDYDDVRVRMAIDPEPVATVGAAERCD